MPLPLNMTLIIACVEITESAKTKLTERWLSHWMLFPGMKGNMAIGLHEIS